MCPTPVRPSAPRPSPARLLVTAAALAIALAVASGRAAAQRNVALGGDGAPPRGPARRNVSHPATVRFKAALVLPDLTVRPVPLHQLELAALADTNVRHALRTGLDGTAVQAVAPGRYRVRSMRPAVLHDSTYRWEVVVQVPAAGATVELTNANAVAAAAPRPALAQAGAREIFARVRSGVFRVEAGLGHGTGFLLDTLGGLVVTNDHVVGGRTGVTVQIDTLTRVPAEVVVRDREADLALLRLPAGACDRCARLRLASPTASGLTATGPTVTAGDRLLAVGFPLSQEVTLTSGIASSVRDGAIISDVNINPGNSGGPLLNAAGEVVGVNTFIEASYRLGPGVSGSVAAHRLGRLLAQAPGRLTQLAPLAPRALPSMPRDHYPVAMLKAFADTATADAYAFFADRDAGRFTVSLSTPTQQFVQFGRQGEWVSHDRRERERQAGVAADERYSEVQDVRDWSEYVGDETAPVVTLTVNPKLGDTGGRRWTRALAKRLAGIAVQAQYRFEGDVRGVRVYRNGVEVTPLRGGHAPRRVFAENRWFALRDVADMGYYVLPPEAFAPDANGAPPRVTVVIQDLKNPRGLSTVDFYDGTSARVWNDFGPYFRATGRGSAWRGADPAASSPRVPYRCAEGAETCAFGPATPVSGPPRPR